MAIGKNFAMKVAAQAAQKMGLNAQEARPHQLHLWFPLSPNENQYRIPLKDEDQRRIAPQVGRGLLDRDGFIAISIFMRSSFIVSPPSCG